MKYFPQRQRNKNNEMLTILGIKNFFFSIKILKKLLNY